MIHVNVINAGLVRDPDPDPDPEKSRCFCNSDPDPEKNARDRDCILLENLEKEKSDNHFFNSRLQ